MSTKLKTHKIKYSDSLKFPHTTHHHPITTRILMALAAAQALSSQLRSEKPSLPDLQKVKLVAAEVPDSGVKLVLQPRVCTLRSFGGGRGGVQLKVNSENQVPQFFEILSDYVESSRKSHDFEILSGRLAMIVFAATVGFELVTGNSVLRKLDSQGLEEAGGVCTAAVASAAVLAWLSSNRSRVGQMFTVGCNTFIDSLIDRIIDGIFYEADISDWSDEV